jgi:hypothetical protein
LVALVAEGPRVALLVVALTVVVQQVEGDVLAPLVFRRAVRLHPVVVLLALTGGGLLGGVLGAFLAVPVVAVAASTVGTMRGHGRHPGQPAPEPDGERDHDGEEARTAGGPARDGPALQTHLVTAAGDDADRPAPEGTRGGEASGHG